MRKTLLVLGTVAILFAVMFCVESVAQAQSPQREQGIETSFDIPDGTPEELLALMRQRAGGFIAVPSRQNQEEVEAYVNLFKELKAIATKALAGNPTGDLRKELLQWKANAYTSIVDYEPDMYPEYEAFVKEVEANPNDREAAMHLRGRFLEFHGNRFLINAMFNQKILTEEEFREHRKAVLEFLNNKDADTYLQLLGMSLVSLSLRVVDQTKDRSLALETAAAVKKLFENSENEHHRRWTYRAEAILNKHWAAEDGLQFKGIQPDGTEFDLASLKGKTVLLILWSNRQVPFNQGRTELEIILPHITELYEKYRSKGLVIVDMCIDTRIRGPVECALGVFSNEEFERQRAVDAAGPRDIEWEEKIKTFPWSIHLCYQRSIASGLPDVMKRYDLFGDHQFLIAPDGKVVVSRMGGTFNPELLETIGITSPPGRMPQPWKDWYSTYEFQHALQEMFPEVAVE